MNFKDKWYQTKKFNYLAMFIIAISGGLGGGLLTNYS